MGVRTRMRIFVRDNLSGLNNQDIEFLTDLILNAIGYSPRFFMPVSEIDKFENRFKDKFSEIFKELDILPALKGGDSYQLHVLRRYSRWVLALPLRVTTSTTAVPQPDFDARTKRVLVLIYLMPQPHRHCYDNRI